MGKTRADVGHPFPEPRLDLRVEELLFGRLAALAGQHDREPRCACGVDRQLRSLVRAEAAHPQHEVLFVLRVGKGVDVDGVVDGSRPVEVGTVAALSVRDRHHVDALPEPSHDLAVVPGDRSMHRDHCRRHSPAGEQRPGHAVVVDQVDVEALHDLSDGGRVEDFRDGFAEPGTRWLVEHRDEAGRRGEVPPGADESDLVSPAGQLVDQIGHHRLDPPVAGRRHLVPGWGDHGDAHQLVPNLSGDRDASRF
jgi:hypothetical protein